MSSTCVLSPNAFNAQSITVDSSGNINKGPIIGKGRTMPMEHQFAQHPALRGWSTTPPSLLASPLNNVSSENFNLATANEVMRGTVTLLSSKQPQRILLSVIRTTVDHLALVYLDNRRNLKCVKPAGCINLRGVTCEEIVLGDGITGITLRPKKSDTASTNLTFVCQEQHHLPKWIEALSQISSENKRNIPKKSALPCLEEEEE